VNLIATNNAANGGMVVWAQGSTKPATSNMNWNAGQTTTNRAVIPVNSSGEISINVSSAAAFLVEVDGYYQSSSGSAAAGSLYRTITPVRMVDTRSGESDALEGGGHTLGAGGTYTGQISGLAGANIPSNADAVVMNASAVGGTAASNLNIYPGDTARPTTSDIDWPAGFTAVDNLTQVGLDSDGTLSMTNLTGNVDVVLDGFGYFVPGEDAPGDCSALSLASNGSLWQGTTETLTTTSSGTNCSSAMVGEVEYQYTKKISGGSSVVLATTTSPTYSFNLSTLIPGSYTYGVTATPYDGGTSDSASTSGIVNTYAQDVQSLTSGEGVTGLRGLWLLNDTGTTASDSSSYNNNGTLTSSGITTREGGPPALGATDSMLFDGSASTGYISIPNSSSDSIGNAAYTITAWINSTSATNGEYQMVFSKDNGTGGSTANYEVRLVGNGSTNTLQMIAPGGGVATSYGGLAINTWYFIVAEYNGSGTYAVAIGAAGGSSLTAAAGSGSAESAVTQPIYIGARNDLYSGGMTFQGRMANVALWTGVLNSTWQTNLYRTDG
ncbi:MAG: hypothetical protein ACREF7_04765, partial [Candidatus Saccharimonadales bacterium]